MKMIKYLIKLIVLFIIIGSLFWFLLKPRLYTRQIYSNDGTYNLKVWNLSYLIDQEKVFDNLEKIIPELESNLSSWQPGWTSNINKLAGERFVKVPQEIFAFLEFYSELMSKFGKIYASVVNPSTDLSNIKTLFSFDRANSQVRLNFKGARVDFSKLKDAFVLDFISEFLINSGIHNFSISASDKYYKVSGKKSFRHWIVTIPPFIIEKQKEESSFFIKRWFQYAKNLFRKNKNSNIKIKIKQFYGFYKNKKGFLVFSRKLSTAALIGDILNNNKIEDHENILDQLKDLAPDMGYFRRLKGEDWSYNQNVMKFVEIK